MGYKQSLNYTMSNMFKNTPYSYLPCKYLHDRNLKDRVSTWSCWENAVSSDLWEK